MGNNTGVILLSINHARKSVVNIIDSDGRLWSWPAVGLSSLGGAIGGAIGQAVIQTVHAAQGNGFDAGAIGESFIQGAVYGAIVGALVGAFTGDPSAAIALGSEFLGGGASGLVPPLIHGLSDLFGKHGDYQDPENSTQPPDPSPGDKTSTGNSPLPGGRNQCQDILDM